MHKKNYRNKSIPKVEFLTVYTDIGNFPDCNRKRWVDFVVPTKWLIKFLGVKTENDVSLLLARCLVDKEAVLIAAITDGVVSYGW